MYTPNYVLGQLSASKSASPPSGKPLKTKSTMRYLHLTFLFCVLSVFSSSPTLENPSSTTTSTLNSATANSTPANDVEPTATNIILQSKDGGQTWQDISLDLPENEEPKDFFAGESDVYMRIKNAMYHSKSNLTTPVWEKVNVPDLQGASIAFNRSGLTAYNYAGEVYKKIPATGAWVPIYTNFKKHSMRSIFEAADGSIFLGDDSGLYKSVDNGKSWRQVQNGGWVTHIVESEGVLVGSGQEGIMRSTDNGEHWESVISEGGVGIAVERIKGGFAAISYNTRTQSRRIRISLDSGKTWKAIDETIQPLLHIPSFNGFSDAASISSIKQIGNYFICGHPIGILVSPDMGKTWNVAHKGVDQKVFKVFASGNTLYAVLMNMGC
jgi:photosystem II stability/assembly factor-like uncharacterized protein